MYLGKQVLVVRKDIKMDRNTPRKGGIRYFQVVIKKKKKGNKEDNNVRDQSASSGMKGLGLYKITGTVTAFEHPHRI